MAVNAYLKNARISPRKAAVVASLVRGRSVADALVILEHTPRRGALYVRRTIASAQANAEHNHNYRPDSLQITEVSVTSGMRIKRIRPVARGQANPFQRKTSNIKVVVDGQKREPKKTVGDKQAATKEAK